MIGDDDNPFRPKTGTPDYLLEDETFADLLKQVHDRTSGSDEVELDPETTLMARLIADMQHKGPEMKLGATDIQALTGGVKLDLGGSADAIFGPHLRYELSTPTVEAFDFAKHLLHAGEYSRALTGFMALSNRPDWLEENRDYLKSILPELTSHARSGKDIASVFIISTRLNTSPTAAPTQPGHQIDHNFSADRMPPLTFPDRPLDHILPDESPTPTPNTTGEAPPDEVGHAFELTPHLDLDRSEPLKIGDRLAITVRLDDRPADAGETSKPVQAAAYSTVEVSFEASGHFRFESARTQQFIADPGKTEIVLPPITLTVAAGALARSGEAPFITAIFYVDNRSCGYVMRSIDIAGLKPQAVAADDRDSKNLLIAPAGPGQADITITIMDTPAKDGRSFIYSVQAPRSTNFRERQTGSWVLQSTARELVRRLTDRFTRQRNAGSQLIAELKGAGKDLFEASPDLFQAALWDLIDAKIPIRTIAIVTADSFVPWELMVPFRTKDNGAYEEFPPLGVQYLVGRWIDGKVISPPRDVVLTDSFVIAPTYIGSDELRHAQDEAKMVLAHYAGESIAPATFDTIQDRLGSTPRSLVHFVCHGKDDGDGIQSIPLEDDTELTSSSLGAMNGLPALFHSKRPVVFLNACKIGQTVPSLIGLGGFAAAFIKLGATAVIAPLWSVEDATARVIAKEFYDQLKAHPAQPLAEIFTSIRKRAYEKQAILDENNEKLGHDTFAAYCFYGDPMATLKSPAA